MAKPFSNMFDTAKANPRKLSLFSVRCRRTGDFYTLASQFVQDYIANNGSGDQASEAYNYFNSMQGMRFWPIKYEDTVFIAMSTTPRFRSAVPYYTLALLTQAGEDDWEVKVQDEALVIASGAGDFEAKTKPLYDNFFLHMFSDVQAVPIFNLQKLHAALQKRLPAPSEEPSFYEQVMRRVRR